MAPRNWGGQKPPLGTPLDPNNPSTLGLRWAFPFNEGGGSITYNPRRDLTTTLSHPVLGAGATWGRGGLDFSGAAGAEVNLGDDGAALVGELTVLFRFLADSVSGLRTLIGNNHTSGNERALSVYLESSLLSVWWGTNDATSVHPIDGTQTIAVNRWYTAAVVRAGATGAWTCTTYLDGVQDDTGATATNPGTNNTPPMKWGTPGAFAGAYLDGVIPWGFIWTRALSEAEVKQYTARPFDLYQPRRTLVRVPYLAAAGGGATTLTADAGSYTLSGQAVGLARGLKLPSDTGSYSLTGQAAALTHQYKLPAAAGSFALTGQTATLQYHHRLTAEVGTHSLTGQTATLTRGRPLAAGAGEFLLDGQDATLVRGRPLQADLGTFTLTGQSAGLLHLHTLTAAAGTFLLGGQEVNLRIGKAIGAGVGEFLLDGQSVHPVLGATKGTFTLSGQDADYLRTYALAAGTGSFALGGQAAGLVRGLSLAAGTGSYSLSGQGAGLARGLRVPADSGTFSLTGQDANLVAGGEVVLTAETGTFTLSGQEVTLTRGRPIGADSGSFSLTGQEATLAHGRVLPVAQGSFTLAGQEAEFLRSYALAAGTGVFVLTGRSVVGGDSEATTLLLLGV